MKIIAPFNNTYSKVGLAAGAIAGAYFGNKEKKLLNYAVLFGIFGAMMGSVVNNIVPHFEKTKSE